MSKRWRAEVRRPGDTRCLARFKDYTKDAAFFRAVRDPCVRGLAGYDVTLINSQDSQPPEIKLVRPQSGRYENWE